MAKKGQKGRVRVFFAEIEGDDETIQDGLKAMATAVSKTFQPTIVKVIENQPINLPSEEFSEEIDDASEYLEELEDDSVDSKDGKKKRNSSGKKRKPPKMSLVKDLDFRPEGKESFAEFVQKKKPSTQNDKVVVSVYWMKTVLERGNLTFNHIYTCFDDAKFRIPNNLPQAVRNCAARKGWVEIIDNDIVVSTRGKNHVEHDLPKVSKN